jgi:3-isopropylmalate/(R)-2-methylmalate dehydratase large subunit
LNARLKSVPDKVRLRGRILFLTEDPELIKRQLAGWDLPWDLENPANNPKLRDDISTDEITPAHYLFLLRSDAGRDSVCWTALRNTHSADWARRGEERRLRLLGERQAARQGIQPGAVALCRDVCGDSSLIAENIERIYKQNCQNLGLLTSTDFSLIDRIRRGRRNRARRIYRRRG